MPDDPPHKIICQPHEYRIVRFCYEVNWDSPQESFIDLRLERKGLVRNLRFSEPTALTIEEGFPRPTHGMQILDISHRQLDGISVEVTDFEASQDAVSFLARSVTDLDAV